MKRFFSAWWGWLSCALALFSGIALITNPDLDRHRFVLHNSLRSSMEAKARQGNLKNQPSELDNKLGMLLGDAVLEQVLATTLNRRNWGLFSLSQFSVDGSSRTVGFGMFGCVWVSEGFHEALQKELSQMRGVEVGDLPMDAFALPTTGASDSTGL